MKEIKDTKETKNGLRNGNSRPVKAETARTSGNNRTAGIKNETNTGRGNTTTNHRNGNTGTTSGRTGQVNNPEGHNQYTPKSKLTGNNR